jgi:hypothetical protein
MLPALLMASSSLPSLLDGFRELDLALVVGIFLQPDQSRESGCWERGVCPIVKEG